MLYILSVLPILYIIINTIYYTRFEACIMHALLTLLLYRCCHFAIDVLDSSLLPTLNVVGIVVAKRSQRSRVVGVASSLRPLQIDARRVQNRPSEDPKSTLRGFKIDPRSPRQVKKRPRSVPAASKSVPRAPKSAPRAPKSIPRAPQERPRAAKSGPRAAKSGPRAAQEHSRAAHERPRATKSSPRAATNGQ